MAGIGFVLRKLARHDNLSGPILALMHSAVIATGPWLLTILITNLVLCLAADYVNSGDLQLFRLIIIYNFAFSLVLGSPINIVITRYVSDLVHEKDLTPIPSILVGGLIILGLIIMIPMACLYIIYFQLAPEIAALAVANCFLTGAIWLSGVFLSAVKDYSAVTIAYLAGVVVVALVSTFFAQHFGINGALIAFGLGFSIILAVLLVKILSEYRFKFQNPLVFLRGFVEYWDLALGAVFFSAAIWVDKWIMWFSPEAEISPNGFLSYTPYDNAMFLANLSLVPLLAVFLFSVETGFFEHYLCFYRDIRQHGSLDQIEKNHRSLISVIIKDTRNLIVIQGSIAILAVLLAPKIYEVVGAGFLGIGIFRFGIMGSTFLAFIMFASILLYYFDARKQALFITAVFLLSNTLFSYLSLRLGFPYYGYGFLLSTFITFMAGIVICTEYIMKLPYHTFISQNTSLESKIR